MWKNFFGTIGARSLTSPSACSRPVVARAAALEVLAHRRHVELGDRAVAEPADLPVVERDELHVCSFSHASDVGRVPVRRKHRIEDLDDPARAGDQRQPPVERQPFDVEGRQPGIAGEVEPLVADDRKRHPVALGELELVLEALRAHAGDAHAQFGQLGVVVAEAARLRRAAARPGNLVPARQRSVSGPTRARIDVEHLEVADVDGALGRRQHEIRQLGAREVVGSAVVDGNRQVLGQDIRIVDGHAASARRFAARRTWLRIKPLNGLTTRQYRTNFRRDTGSGT